MPIEAARKLRFVKTCKALGLGDPRLASNRGVSRSRAVVSLDDPGSGHAKRRASRSPSPASREVDGGGADSVKKVRSNEVDVVRGGGGGGAERKKVRSNVMLGRIGGYWSVSHRDFELSGGRVVLGRMDELSSLCPENEALKQYVELEKGALAMVARELEEKTKMKQTVSLASLVNNGRLSLAEARYIILSARQLTNIPGIELVGSREPQDGKKGEAGLRVQSCCDRVFMKHIMHALYCTPK